MKHPLVGIWGNAMLLAKNLAPPFFPAARWWNESALTLLPHAVVGPMVANFEAGFYTLGELPVEDSAGLGFGVSWLVIISVVAAWWVRPRAQAPWVGSRCVPAAMRRVVLVAPWVSLLAYFMKIAMMDLPRHISAFYPLLLPALLVGARQAVIVRRRWWRALALGRDAAGRARAGADARTPACGRRRPSCQGCWPGNPTSGCSSAR